MKLVLALMVAFGVMGFVSRGYAADPPAKKADDKKADAKKAKNVRGEVVKIDGSKVTLKIKDKEAASGTKEIVIATDANTQVMIEGTPSKLTDLKAGQKVVVTPAEGTAVKIAVPKPKEKTEKKPAK